jgi:predicted nucleic acid-binding protein
MRRIFWDTNLFIYLIEQAPSDLHARVVRLRERMLASQDRLVTSSLTLGEVLVKPIAAKRPDLVTQYKAVLAGPSVTLVHFDETVAERFAELRAAHGKSLKPPDAVQLACASISGVDLFVTNDDRLNKCAAVNVGYICALPQA